MNDPLEAGWTGTGLVPLAGRVLEHLVRYPESTVPGLAEAVGAPAPAVTVALRSLEKELLVVPVGRRPARWSASPPRAALGAMLGRRRAELARVETLVEHLHDIYSATSHHRFASDQFEVLDSQKLVTARYTHLLRASEHEILHLVMPPYVASLDAVPERLEAQAVAIRKGVRSRSVYDSDTFTDDLSLETAREAVAMGGEVRLISGLPMKLVLFDGATAIMPLREHDPGAGSLLVHSRTLLHVLVSLFDSLWEHAVPWGPGRPATAPRARAASSDAPDERTREVLRLMSLGMKDDAIARVLSVSRRTVQKHVSDAGVRLGARTRFQIALLAKDRGWLDPAAKEPPPAAAVPEPRAG